MQEISCDFIVSATGVTPVSQLHITPTLISDSRSSSDERGTKKRSFGLNRTDDGAIIVNDFMNTSLDWCGVFAAGDCVEAHWSSPSRHWIQMRLWSQVQYKP